MKRDAEHGRRKFRLTTGKAGEIAHAAGVGYLITLHFSPRYRDKDLALLHAEAAATFGGKIR